MPRGDGSERVDDGLGERRDIVRLVAGDQLAIAHDPAVLPIRLADMTHATVESRSMFVGTYSRQACRERLVTGSKSHAF
jgi:hypothetical protein